MKSESLTAAGPNDRRWWLLLILAAGLGVELLFEGLSPESPVRQLAASTFQGRAPAVAASRQPVDDALRRLPPDGNVVLQITGGDREDPGWQQYASFIYYRSVYLLYPRTVTLAPPERTVNNGRQVLAAVFQPDSSWILRHDIHYILRFHQDQDQLAIDVLPTAAAGGNEHRR
jgi:hypothetical protein